LRGAEVHAVHVREANCHSLASYAVPSHSGPAYAEPPPSASDGDDADDADDADYTDAVVGFDAGFSIDETVRSVQPDLAPGTEVRTEVVDGLAARVLLDRCAGADMLVLGTASDESGAPRSAGPVIRACLRRAPCPVVVISVAQDPLRYREPAFRPAGAGAATAKATATPPAAVPAGAGV
jgi:nucleotide-binding universal stress UspA family protein